MSTPNYDFSKDLPIAKKTEQQIADFLVETQNMKFIGTSDTIRGVRRSDFDIRVAFPTGKEVDIEIKEDFSCARTGNVGVECESWGRASGIEISKAHFYLYKVHQPDGTKRVYIIQTSKLKQMIEDELYHRIVVGGDPGSNSKNYLFKLKVIMDNFKYLGKLDV
jgi:hypothetical protein